MRVPSFRGAWLLVLLLPAPSLRAQPRWTHPPGLELEARRDHALARDTARGVVVLFGGRSDALLGDTWEWNGTAWTARTPAHAPPARAGHALAYDSARGRVVLFGGRGDSSLLSDTWEWDGSDWSQLAAPGPAAREAHAMAYDAGRGRTVLFGGIPCALCVPDAAVWEWDGTSWTPGAASGPGARARHALASDPATGRTLLFGGQDATAFSALDDTWSWDGTAWARLAPSRAPAPRFSHALAADVPRARVVLHGGQLATWNTSPEVWEWDGTDWSPRTPPVPVLARESHALAHDGVRVVAFGGWDGTSFGSETHGWNGAAWTLLRSATAPAPRAGHVLAYEPWTRRTILFGGRSGGRALAEMWAWDGRWTRLFPPLVPASLDFAVAVDTDRRRTQVLFGSPPARDLYEWDGTSWWPTFPTTRPFETGALAYDSRRRRTVFFSALSQTWEWDGTDWRGPLATPGNHNAGFGGAMAYDRRRGVCVYFAGRSGVIENGTWEWNGTVWTERAPATRPPPRIRHTMVWDEGRARCVVYGGTSGAGWLSDVWEWDGTNWTQRSPAPVPAGRESHAAAWDLHRARMVVFGGNASAGLSDETLEYAAPCDVAGAGHPGGGLPLTCLAPPVLGTAFRVAFPSPRGAAWLALAPAPVLAPALAVGPPEFCGPGSIHLAAAAVAALGGDPALFEFPLPAEPALAGVAVVMQGTALQAAGCLRLTDAVIAVLEAP